MLGNSGAGKSILGRTLDEALPFRDTFGLIRFHAIEVGSGEAIAEMYARSAAGSDDADTDGLAWHARALMFGFDEVGRLAAMKGRTGSTVLEYVKTALTGDRLGRRLAGRGGVELPSDSYRFVCSINAQPRRSGVLLNADEVAGGLPGRLAWFSTTNRDARADFNPTPVEPWVVKSIAWEGISHIRATPAMDAAHAEDRFSSHEGTRDDIDGHRMLTRAKIAVALMRLDGRVHLSDADWELSEVVMKHSDTTRATAQLALDRAEREEATERGKREGIRLAVADDERGKRILATTRAKAREVMAASGNPAALRHYSTAQREVLGIVLAELGMGPTEEAA